MLPAYYRETVFGGPAAASFVLHVGCPELAARTEAERELCCHVGMGIARQVRAHMPHQSWRATEACLGSVDCRREHKC